MSFYKVKRALKPYNMAIISVFIAVFSISVVSLMSMAGKSEIAKELDGVGLNGMSIKVLNSNNENITDLQLYDKLSQCDDINLSTPVLYDYAQLNFVSGVCVDSVCWGISPMAENIVNLEKVHGRMLAKRDITNKSFVCMIDENIALQAYSRSNIVGKKLYISMGKGIYQFEIIGIVNKTSNVLNGLSGDIIPNFIYIPYTTMESISDKNNVDQILINVKNDNVNEYTIENFITEKIKLSDKSTLQITNLSRQRDSINNIVDIAFWALFAVSCVAVIVCGISVATAVNTAVNAAKHNIGIKISLGAGKIDIICEFLFYSLLACCIGILYGLLCGLILLMCVNVIFQTGYRFDFMLLNSGIFATIILAIIFSLYPSYQAASMLPVEALNRE